MKDSSKEEVPLVEEDQHRKGLLRKWVIPDSMAPNKMHPRVPGEVGDVTLRPLSVSKR